MSTISSFLRKYPVSVYFIATFLISWGGVIAVVSPNSIPATPDRVEKLFPWALVAMLAGPCAMGLLMTGLVYGKRGMNDFVSRLLKWKIGLHWYVIALVTVPMLTGIILWLLSQTFPEYLPRIVTAKDKGELFMASIGIGLAAGFFEEIGWTGFATHSLKKNGVIFTGLVIGLIWGVWHFLVTFWASGDSAGMISRELLIPPLVFYVGVLPAYRVLMVWVYDRTESLFIAMLMHANLTACTVSLFLPPATGGLLVRYYIILAAAMWVVIGNFLRSKEPMFQNR